MTQSSSSFQGSPGGGILSYDDPMAGTAVVVEDQ